MENSLDESSNINASVESSSFFHSPKGFIVFIIVVLIILAGASYSFIFSGKKDDNLSLDNKPTVTQAQPKSSDMVVYGIWKDNKSVVKSYDIGSKKEYILAELPFNIKKITVLSSSKLLLINDTNSKDHGKELAVFDMFSKSLTSLIKADEGFGIDDYKISSNKKYIVIWEVLFKPGSDFLIEGKSKVVAVDLTNPSIKNVVYDENSTIEDPVHYPVGVTDTGKIFLDKFMPNSGARPWAYGMSVSNFKGTDKKDIETMKNGTYASAPSLSPKGDFMVFSGFDGAEEEGKKIIDGMRRAVSARNTVELLNTENFERIRLDNFSNKNEYDFVNWESSGDILVSIIPTKDSSNIIGKYIYGPQNKSLQKLNLNNFDYVSSVSDTMSLLGQAAISISAAGNLGDKYSTTYSSLYLNDNRKEPVKLDISDSFIQYIASVPFNFFDNNFSLTEVKKDTLQMYSFAIKPSLAPKREKQQTNLPPKIDLPKDDTGKVPDNTDWCSDPKNKENPFYEYQCEGDPQGCTNREMKWIQDQCAKDPNYHPGYPTCYDYYRQNSQFNCMGTPLYLYGDSGTKVKVKVKTYVYNSVPLYSQNGYNVKLLDNGKVEVNGKTYESINYEISGNKKITQPDYGLVSTKENLEKTIRLYAQKMGLNEKETNDLIDYGNENIKAPFVFVSFFDQNMSEQILPLEFNPKPDTYINIVFYFKEYQQKPAIKPEPPIFTAPLKRNGFTAVEISEVIDK